MYMKAWKSARIDEIEQQKAIQLQYDWTFTSPYSGTVVGPSAKRSGPEDGDVASEPELASTVPCWQETKEQVRPPWVQDV
jgi:type 2A phosphatase activator TIP41